MADKKKRAESHLTPAGIAQYPRLSKPDTKFKPEGEYKVTLIVDGETSAPLRAKIDAAMLTSLAAAKKDLVPAKAKLIKAASDKPYKPVLDEEGEETGKYSFNFKMKAVIETRTGERINKRPSLFDAKGKPLDPAKVSVGGGSVVKVSFEMYEFYTPAVGAGVSLRLLAVQIIKLVEYTGGRDAAGYGFGVEEDGYSADEASEGSATEGEPADTGGEPADAQDF